MSKTSLARGEIVLVQFPLTDLTAKKVRPAVILSAEPRSEDVIVAFISSSPESKSFLPTDYLCEEKRPDFAQTGLKRSSTFRMSKLVTLHRSMILRRLGMVSAGIQKELDARLKKALVLE